MIDLQRVWKAIAAMESDVANVERWGMVLNSMGTSSNVEPEAVFVVGEALVDAGQRLRNDFEAALEVARREGAKPCA